MEFWKSNEINQIQYDENMMICMKIYGELEDWNFEIIGQNDQNTPNNKTMALKPGFSEINFAKLKKYEMQMRWKLTLIWYLHAYLYE